MSPATTTLTLPFPLAASSELRRPRRTVTVSPAARRPRQTATLRTDKKQRQSNVGFGGGGGGGKKKEPSWHCVEGCGACCKLDKGPSFPSPEEIFSDPSHVELYKSLIGPDGWCIHYEKSTRKCSIYPERPYFCRVEPEVFKSLYEINEKKFNKEACRLFTAFYLVWDEFSVQRFMFKPFKHCAMMSTLIEAQLRRWCS